MRFKSGDVVATIALDQIESNFRRAELRLEGLTPPLESFELRVFIDEPHANAHTPINENPHYLGSQYFYGLGVPDQPLGLKNPFRLGSSSQSAPTQIRLNISERLKDYLKGAPPHTAPLSLAAVDRNGKEITDPGLQFEGVSIVTS